MSKIIVISGAVQRLRRAHRPRPGRRRAHRVRRHARDAPAATRAGSPRRKQYAERARRGPAHRRARRVLAGVRRRRRRDGRRRTRPARRGRPQRRPHGHRADRGVHARADRRASTTPTCSAPSGSTAPPCRTCASRADGLRAVGRQLEHPRRHPAVPGAVLRGEGGRWTRSRSATPPSWPGSASRRRSSCPARSPAAPTTSPAPAGPPTTSGRRPSTRRTTPG